MTFKDKIKTYIEGKRAQIQRGREVTEQMRAEKPRKKNDWIDNTKPGSIRAIRVGLASKANPLDVMKEEYYRRKYERENKYERK